MKLSVGHNAAWFFTSGFCSPKRSQVSRNVLNSVQPPLGLDDLHGVGQCGDGVRRVQSCVQAVSRDDVVAEPLHPQREAEAAADLRVEPIRMRLPSESILVSF